MSISVSTSELSWLCEHFALQSFDMHLLVHDSILLLLQFGDPGPLSSLSQCGLISLYLTLSLFFSLSYTNPLSIFLLLSPSLLLSLPDLHAAEALTGAPPGVFMLDKVPLKEPLSSPQPTLSFSLPSSLSPSVPSAPSALHQCLPLPFFLFLLSHYSSRLEWKNLKENMQQFVRE